MHLLKIQSEVQAAVSTVARDAFTSTFTATWGTLGSQAANYRPFRLTGKVVVNVFIPKLEVRVHKRTSARPVLETDIRRMTHLFKEICLHYSHSHTLNLSSEAVARVGRRGASNVLEKLKIKRFDFVFFSAPNKCKESGQIAISWGSLYRHQQTPNVLQPLSSQTAAHSRPPTGLQPFSLICYCGFRPREAKLIDAVRLRGDLLPSCATSNWAPSLNP